MRPEALQRFFVMNRSAVRYDGMMREWLAQYKYRGHERYAPLLVKMLSQALIRMQLEINSLKGGLQHSKQSAVWKPDLITFVPVSKARLIERGFNQAQIFAEGLGKLHHIPIASLLVRSMHTEKQSFKTRAERIESMKGAFELIPEEHFVREIARLKGFDQPGALRTLQILIVDDIYTTGSTLNTCAYVLRQAAKLKMGLEANIYCLTWARS
jgi:predicted amidophosphoribosyltransferase